MEQLLDAAVVENIGNQATNTDNHDLVDAPVGNIPDIAAVENIDNQSNNNDNRNVVDAPVGNVTDQLLNVDNHHMADNPQPVGVPPDIPWDGWAEPAAKGQMVERARRKECVKALAWEEGTRDKNYGRS